MGSSSDLYIVGSWGVVVLKPPLNPNILGFVDGVVLKPALA